MKCSHCGAPNAREAVPGTGLYLCDGCIAKADRS